jgi:hypothetical protein
MGAAEHTCRAAAAALLPAPLHCSLTVYEMLLYTAELKRPLQEPLASKKEAVEGVLAKLALNTCRCAAGTSSVGCGVWAAGCCSPPQTCNWRQAHLAPNGCARRAAAPQPESLAERPVRKPLADRTSVDVSSGRPRH